MSQDNIIPIGNYNNFEDVLCVNKIITQAREHVTLQDLFSGFDKIRIITYSYSLGFIEHLIKYFKYVEIIIGADYIHEFDTDFKKLEAYVLSMGKYYNDEVAKLIKKYPTVKQMLESGDLIIRLSRVVIDHRKVYILNDTKNLSHTRVITGSANMSMSAWFGNQMEIIDYDDGELRYEIESNSFETAINLSSDITHETVIADIDDYVSSNPILQTAKNNKSCEILFANINAQDDFNKKIEYVVNVDKNKDLYSDLLKSSKLKSTDTNGLPVVSAKQVEYINKKQDNYKLKKINDVKIIEQNYPFLKIDLDTGSVLYNDKPWDLNVSDDLVKSDIDELLGIFNNFDDFVGDTDELKRTHFKLLTIMLSSPFHASLRNFEYSIGQTSGSMPMFLTASSITASCGKTFMIQAILKLMTGKDIKAYIGANTSLDDLRNYQLSDVGFPIFIDEVDAASFGENRYGKIIKGPELCERHGLIYMPMLIFATNAVDSFSEKYRKRMVSLKFTARFPSNRDETKARVIANNILSKLGTAFYRKYILKMIDFLNIELEKISLGVPVGYYIDIAKLSSSAIISVLKDYNYDIPSYIQELNWHEHYSVNSSENYSKVLKEVEEYYKLNKSAFDFNKSDKVIINLEDNDKKAKAWVDTLPSEINAQYIASSKSKLVVCDKTEFFKRVNIKCGILNRLFGKV
jgi:hypothetical protein